MDYETSVILDRLQIRMISKFFRKMFNIKTTLFPVMKVLDALVKRFSDVLYYSVEEDELFDPRVMAILEPQEDGMYCIRIRQSVYNNAINGDGASLGYICHEECHFILIHLFNIGPRIYTDVNGIRYARCVKEKEILPYKSMEWQAKALCGEVMIPYETCKNCSLDEIIKMTNSSKEQAKYFLNRVVVECEEEIKK